MEQAFAQAPVLDQPDVLSAIENANEQMLRDLLDAELLCIGGGSGDVCLG